MALKTMTAKARAKNKSKTTKSMTNSLPSRARKAIKLNSNKSVVGQKVDKQAKGVGHTGLGALAKDLAKDLAKELDVGMKAPKVLSTVNVKALSRSQKAQKPVRAAARRVRTELVASEIAQAMFGELEQSESKALARQAARSQRERDLLSRLACSMSRTDDMPNLELAADIVEAANDDAVSILVASIERHDIDHGPDAARVLYEVGTRAPHLLEKHAERLLGMCDVDQRDVLPWTMFALSPVAARHADSLWDLRDLFWSALADLTQPANMAQAGAVRLLSALCAAGPDYARTLAGGLVDLLGKCMPRDVAFFAESVLPALGAAHSHRAKPVLDRRMKELTPAEVARLRRAVRAAQTGQPLAA